MKTHLLYVLLTLFSASAYADTTPDCKKGTELITSVNHSLCATVTSPKANVINVTMPAGAGSDLDAMHKTFGDKIYQDYVEGVKVQKIPAGVAHLIRFVHYKNDTYECQKLVVTTDAILKMTQCIKQKANS